MAEIKTRWQPIDRSVGMTRRQQQQKLWHLLGQVTAAQRWHTGMMQQLKLDQYLNDNYAAIDLDRFIQSLKHIEKRIRADMKNIPKTVK